MDRAERHGLPGRVGLVTALVLLVLTGLALFVSQRLKRQPLVVDRVEFVATGARPAEENANVFSPNGDCRRDGMMISFRTTRSDRARIQVVTPERKVVRTLARDRFLKRYRIHRFFFDGDDNAGRPLPTGRYRLRVRMLDQNRTLILPGKMRLHRFEPRDSACGERS